MDLTDVTTEELARRLGEPGLTVLDVRSEAEFSGAAGAPCDPRQGHILGALNLDVTELVGLAPQELRELVAPPARGRDRHLLPLRLPLCSGRHGASRRRLRGAQLRGLVARVVPRRLAAGGCRPLT